MICRVCNLEKSLNEMYWKGGKVKQICKKCEKKQRQKRMTEKDFDSLGKLFDGKK